MKVIHGFELVREQEIPELNTRARLFRHVKTGAELLSLENDDENKVFAITFRTPPKNSTGVAHIMEHSVLCGSRKYPLKEPFVELVKGSLNTFLNAFTYPDKTCYPVASQNLQDFYNLIDVYLDAVFYPRINPSTLEQEGWHYELNSLDEPLTYKGVVFNEMKGNYSSPDGLLARYTQQSIFPDNTYGVDSGGDPSVITDLTYDEFVDFHRRYYHPSNSRIYFYGDGDPDERLQLVDNYLKDFDRLAVDSTITLQPYFDRPKEIVIPYDAGEENQEKAFVTVNWLLPQTANPETSLGFHMLNYILIGTPASPLRKALIDSGLGEDLTGPGLESEFKQMFFSTGLKGTAFEDAGKVKDLIFKTLSELVEKGIDADMIAAAANTIEFRLRENNTGSFPRGLSLMLSALTTWLYDADPLSPLSFETSLNAIKQQLDSGGRYFEDLIQTYMLENQHWTLVTLKPDPNVKRDHEAAEQARLRAVRDSLTEQQLQGIVEETRQLKLRQETPDSPEALATIPTLKLSDLETEIKKIPLDIAQQDGSQVLYHDLFTNGIVYLDLGFALHALPQEYLPYVPLFGRALLEIGTENEDFVKLSQRIGRSTGGIRPASLTSVVRSDGQASGQSTAWLFLRGKSTAAQSADLLAILRDILLTVKLDNQERFKQMVLEEKASQESGVVPAGHRVVNTRLRSLFDEAGWASEQMNGVANLFFLRWLAEEVDRNWPAVLERLENMRKALVDRSQMLCNTTLDQANYVAFKPQLDRFLTSLPAASNSIQSWNPTKESSFEGLTIPAQVNYVGKGANLYELGYQLDGSIYVINKYLSTTWIWEKVRVQGGAYGGFCLFDHRSGVYTFLSYRDPNLLNTLENYNLTGQFLRRLEIGPEELIKSIIGTIGDMDAYLLPDAKGYTSMVRYLGGDTDESRQKMRDEVLSTTLEDFHAFGDVLDQLSQDGSVVVLGSQETISAANQARGGWLDVVKVL